MCGVGFEVLAVRWIVPYHVALSLLSTRSVVAVVICFVISRLLVVCQRWVKVALSQSVVVKRVSCVKRLFVT